MEIKRCNIEKSFGGRKAISHKSDRIQWKFSHSAGSIRLRGNRTGTDDCRPGDTGCEELPGRSDIKCEDRSNLDDIPQLKIDWVAMMKIASDTAVKLDQICG